MSYEIVFGGIGWNWQTMKKKKDIAPRWNNNVEVSSHVNKIYLFGNLSLEDLQLLIKISRNLLVISTLTELGWKQSLPINSGQNVSKNALSYV